MHWFGPGSSHRDCYRPPRSTSQLQSNRGFSTCSPLDLSGQLLATCRLIYHECIDVLYGENVFGLHIYIREGRNHGGIKVEMGFFEGFEINDLDPPWPTPKLYPRGRETDDPFEVRYQFAVHKIRRLRLVLDLDSEHVPAFHAKYNLLKHILHIFCQRLKKLTLQSLNIDLHSRYPMTRFCILDPFQILRGVSKVIFEPEPQNLRLIRSHNSFHRRRDALILRRRPKRDRSLATLPLQIANHYKQLLESTTPVGDSFLRAHSCQLIGTYLRMNEASSTIEDHLRFLHKDDQTIDYFNGLYEDCKHPPDDELHELEKQVVSDNETNKSENENEWEADLNRDELEGDKLEGDKLKRNRLEGDKLEGDKLEEDKLKGDKLEEDKLKGDKLEEDGLEGDGLEGRQEENGLKEGNGEDK